MRHKLLLETERISFSPFFLGGGGLLSSTLKKVLKSTQRACTVFHLRMRQFQANAPKKKKKKGLSHSLLPRGKNDLFFHPSFSPVTDSHWRISLASVSLVL